VWLLGICLAGCSRSHGQTFPANPGGQGGHRCIFTGRDIVGLRSGAHRGPAGAFPDTPGQGCLYGIHGAGRHVYLCIDYDRTRIHQNGVDQAPGIPNAGHRR